MRCAGAEFAALADEAHDAACDEARDLHHGDALAGRGRNDEGVALVVLAGLVEIGAEEGAGAVDDALDAARRPDCGSRGNRTRS